MTNKELKQAVMDDIVLLSLVGVKVVLVHGGGPEISDMLKRLNIESKFIGGLRYTDEEAVDVVKMVLSGKVNKDLVNLLTRTKGKALGLCGIDGQMLTAERKSGPNGEDLGFVGDIVKVNERPIWTLWTMATFPSSPRWRPTSLVRPITSMPTRRRHELRHSLEPRTSFS